MTSSQLATQISARVDQLVSFGWERDRAQHQVEEWMKPHPGPIVHLHLGESPHLGLMSDEIPDNYILGVRFFETTHTLKNVGFTEVYKVLEASGHADYSAGFSTQSGNYYSVSPEILDQLLSMEAAAIAADDLAAEQAHQALLRMEIPEYATKAFDRWQGDPERVRGDIENPDYWSIRMYADAIIAQRSKGTQ